MTPSVRRMLAKLLHVGSAALRPVSLLIDYRRIFYRDVLHAGGPRAAVERALRDIGSPLPVTGDSTPTVASVSRSANVFVAPAERLFTIQFWSRGVFMAEGATPFLPEAARAIDLWVASRCTTHELADAARFVRPSLEAAMYESGDPVEYQWQVFLSPDFPGENPRLIAFLHAASRRPQLRVLFPCTSLFSLRFSRCTTYPYTTDVPYVQAIGDHGYTVFTPDGTPAAHCATADEAADLVVQLLPPDCGTAVVGTADDLAGGPLESH